MHKKVTNHHDQNWQLLRGISWQCFFFPPWKKKSARESHFWPFCRFFHGQFFFFTGTFLPFFTIFHAQLVFFHGQFYGFVRFFHGQKIVFTGKNFIFFTGNFRFSRATFVLWKLSSTFPHSGFCYSEKKVSHDISISKIFTS